MEFTITKIDLAEKTIKLPTHPEQDYARVLLIIRNYPNISRSDLIRKVQRIGASKLTQIIEDLKTDGLILEEVYQGKGRKFTDYVVTPKSHELFN